MSRGSENKAYLLGVTQDPDVLSWFIEHRAKVNAKTDRVVIEYQPNYPFSKNGQVFRTLIHGNFNLEEWHPVFKPNEDILRQAEASVNDNLEKLSPKSKTQDAAILRIVQGLLSGIK